ncbi:ABC transporter permease [Candidatus Woesearchaeota archaeon]|nr:ABC transporter permease [Candidatus Woesearchaeota archaeon]
MRAFSASFEKDMKLLFRNWTSLFVSVIGPLSIMLVLIIAFSDLGFNSITIGHVVDPANVRFDSLWPKLSYVGNFVPYASLDDCTADLKTQRLHLCLQPSGDALNAYFDNTRELISLILLNQVRAAVNAEKEALVRQKAAGFLGEVKNTADFLDSSGSFAAVLLKDLERQRVDLVQAKSDLRSTREDVELRIDELREVRSEVSSAHSQAESAKSQGFGKAEATLGEADAALYNAYNVAAATGDAASMSAISAARSEVQASRNDLSEARSLVDGELSRVQKVIDGIDEALQSLERARDVIIRNEQRVSNAIETIDQRSVELRDLQTRIDQQGSKLDDLGKTSVDEVVKPITVGFMPLFVGSERLRDLEAGWDLTENQKQRLLNFGTIQTFLPFVLSLLICFVATMLSNILLLEELHSPAFLRNQLMPRSWLVSFGSLFLTVLFVTTCQVLVILLMGYFIFYLDILKSLGTLLAVLLLLIGTHTLIGMTIAYVVRTKTTSLLVCAFFLMVTLILGGVVYPVERMASFMSTVASLIPFTSGISMLQQSLFYNVSLSDLLGPLAILIVIFFGAAVVMCVARWAFMDSCRRG